MPKFYTVSTNNAFAALDEQEDGDDLILNQSPEQINQLTAERQTATAPNASVTATTKDARSAVAAEQKKRAGPRVSRGPANPDQQMPQRRPRRSPSREAQEPNEQDGIKEAKVIRERKLRPEGRLERRSGTGHGREVKKDGAGAHSWGQPGVEAAADQPDTLDAANNRADDAEGNLDQAAPESKPENTIQSFADYKAEQNKNRDDRLEEKQPNKSDTSAALAGGVRVYTKAVGEEATIKSAAPTADRAKGSSGSSPVVNFRYNNPRPPRDDNSNNNNNSNSNNNRRERGSNDRKPTDKTETGGETVAELKLDDTESFPTLAH